MIKDTTATITITTKLPGRPETRTLALDLSDFELSTSEHNLKITMYLGLWSLDPGLRCAIEEINRQNSLKPKLGPPA
jgi:hypothetical protein